MSTPKPEASKSSNTLFIVISSIIAVFLVGVSLGVLVNFISTSEVRAEVRALEKEPLVIDDIPGLQETRLSASRGGEALGKPVYTKAFRTFKFEEGFTAGDATAAIIEKAEASGWEFERFAYSANPNNESFRMSKSLTEIDRNIWLFVSFPSDSEILLDFTIRQ